MNFAKFAKNSNVQRSKISEDLEEARNILRNLEKTRLRIGEDGPEDKEKLSLVDRVYNTVFCNKEIQVDIQLNEQSVGEYERRIGILQSDLDKARIETIKANKEKKKLQEKLSKLSVCNRKLFYVLVI